MSKFTLAAILAFAAANAAAASNPETVFACALQNGKRVDIRYQAAKGARAATVLYRYGANLTRPEIAFAQPAEQVYYTQMQGAVERSDDEGGTFMQGGMPVHILHLSPNATQKHDISAILQTGGDHGRTLYAECGRANVRLPTECARHTERCPRPRRIFARRPC